MCEIALAGADHTTGVSVPDDKVLRRQLTGLDCLSQAVHLDLMDQVIRGDLVGVGWTG